MAEQDKSLVKSSHPLTRFDPKARKELVVRGLNALSEVKDAGFYFFKGEEHRMRGELKLAISYYEKALQIDSEHEDSLCWMGLSYLSLVEQRSVDDVELDKTIRNERAAAAFQKLISICKKKDSVGWGPVPYLNLGHAQCNLSLYEKAAESYEQSIVLDPEFFESYTCLGWAQYNLGLYEAAIESYKRAIELNPDDADSVPGGELSIGRAYNNLSLAYYTLGRYQDAIESCKQAIRIKPDFANAHYGLGVNYLRTGDKGSALEEYKILKTMDAEWANKLFKLIYK